MCRKQWSARRHVPAGGAAKRDDLASPKPGDGWSKEDLREGDAVSTRARAPNSDCGSESVLLENKDKVVKTKCSTTGLVCAWGGQSPGGRLALAPAMLVLSGGRRVELSCGVGHGPGPNKNHGHNGTFGLMEMGMGGIMFSAIDPHPRPVNVMHSQQRHAIIRSSGSRAWPARGRPPDARQFVKNAKDP